MKHYFQFVRLFLWPHIGLFIGALLTGLLAAAASGLGIPAIITGVFPILFEGTVPDKVPANVREVMLAIPHARLVLGACICIPFIFVLRGLAMWGNAVMVNYLGIRILESLRMAVFKRIQALPLAYVEHQRKGDLISRVLADTGSVQSIISQVANDLVKQPFTCMSALAAFIWLLVSQGGDGWTFLVNLVFITCAAYPIILFGKRISRRAQQAQAGLGELNSIVQQNLETQREVRAYAMEPRQIGDFEAVSEHYCKNLIKLVKYQRALVPIMETVTALGLAFLLVKGKMAGMQLTDFMALAAALFFFFDSLKRTGTAFNRFSEAQGALNRLGEVLNQPDTMPDPAEPHQLVELRGSIDFEHLSFDYGNGKRVLDDINIHIPAGQIVGLVGPSGAGKTTFVNLIPRFYEASEGCVKVDGIDVRELNRHELREHLALVGQQALLFSGSIRENIALGKPTATEADVDAAAAAASVTQFLPSQAQGLDTKLGQGGAGLSGGQRQRVAIARAFVKDAPILILDEATASLDAKSEREIQQELDHLSQGRTTLIVAHRFSTIRNADRILVFDGGRIVGDGTHAELHSNCPLYRELHDKQAI